MTTAAAYLRRSTDAQAASLERQRDEVKSARVNSGKRGLMLGGTFNGPSAGYGYRKLDKRLNPGTGRFVTPYVLDVEATLERERVRLEAQQDDATRGIEYQLTSLWAELSDARALARKLDDDYARAT